MLPRGELFISTEKMIFSNVMDGKVVQRTKTFYGYADAFERYGLSLSVGAIDKLMAPVPHKEPASNKSAVRHGAAYIGATVGKVDERVLSLDVSIVASSKEDYLRRYQLLCDEVLSGGIVYVRTSHRPELCYRLLYQSSEQFRQWMSGGVAMFTLSFIEPHPELQAVEPQSIFPDNVTIIMSPRTDAGVEIMRSVDSTEYFTAEVTCPDPDITYSIEWESSDESVATVEPFSSLITGQASASLLSLGATVITASARIGGFILASDECAIRVVRNIIP